MLASVKSAMNQETQEKNYQQCQFYSRGNRSALW